MFWYTASVIISCRIKNGLQKTYPVYENFILIQAENKKEAYEKAIEIANFQVSVKENLTLNDTPAYWKFEGIRKLVLVTDSNYQDAETLDSGSEVSYSYMEVTSIEDLEKLGAGKQVAVNYIDFDKEDE